ncbi:hypothetical protein [Clostridium sp. YIM B02551]|uniref:hypothetical protein n=1 Tax=Clostridium sp. YIM B02551 TaxID=2910679 RepID=UPI001EEBAE4B|nr:hypothetical protein [Clostridium sp. YIM B02551]
MKKKLSLSTDIIALVLSGIYLSSLNFNNLNTLQIIALVLLVIMVILMIIKLFKRGE